VTLDEQILMVALWNEGLSALQIAQRMRRTRNAIIGRIYRLRQKQPEDVRLRPRPADHVTRHSFSTRQRMAQATRANLPPAPKAKPRPLPKPPPPKATKVAPVRTPDMPVNPKPWMQRAFGQCAFPLEEDGSPAVKPDSEVALSCCDPVHIHPRKGAQTYCLAHCQVMFWAYGKERAMSQPPRLRTDGKYVT
jgi:hypothetical protein